MARKPAGPDPLSAAIEAALSRFAGIVRRVGRHGRLSERDLDELVQEVRIRLWRAHEGDPEATEQIRAAPASYVYRTAVTATLDLFRRRRARREADMVPLDGEGGGVTAGPGPEEDLAAHELAALVARAVDRLPATRRPVVRMYLAGHSKEEIAELMGWTEGKTRNLLYRGLADLRAELTAMGMPGTTT
jgi:RNA polymerase sigma-70 factor (ECF subfamily)